MQFRAIIFLQKSLKQSFFKNKVNQSEPNVTPVAAAEENGGPQEVQSHDNDTMSRDLTSVSDGNSQDTGSHDDNSPSRDQDLASTTNGDVNGDGQSHDQSCDPHVITNGDSASTYKSHDQSCDSHVTTNGGKLTSAQKLARFAFKSS